MAAKLESELGVHVLNISTSVGYKTYDGIDVCGDRALVQLAEHVAELEKPGPKQRIVKQVLCDGVCPTPHPCCQCPYVTVTYAPGQLQQACQFYAC